MVRIAAVAGQRKSRRGLNERRLAPGLRVVEEALDAGAESLAYGVGQGDALKDLTFGGAHGYQRRPEPLRGALVGEFLWASASDVCERAVYCSNYVGKADLLRTLGKSPTPLRPAACLHNSTSTQFGEDGTQVGGGDRLTFPELRGGEGALRSGGQLHGGPKRVVRSASEAHVCSILDG